MRRFAVIPILVVLLGLATSAVAENDVFLSRDETIPADVYTVSDGGELAPKPSDSDWDTFVTPEEPETAPERFELPGPFPIKQTAPELQTVVFGPTFRNQKNRIEVGAGLGYINNKFRFPFELSVEPTYRRNKNVSSGERNFRRVRTFGLIEWFSRGSNWESTAFATTLFYDWQENSFDNLEAGVSVSQSFGRRFTISGNLAWGGDWPNQGSFNNAAFGSIGASYNLGAGVRFGGFYEPDNNYTHENDFGGFIAWQALPFVELAVNAGKSDFVLVRLMFSYALERPH